MEVAQIAKSIATKLNSEQPFLKEQGEINLDLVEVAALAHDLGHPPFGHNGELALDRCMIKHGGFEGNAQTLRILSVLEKKKTNDHVGYGVKKEAGTGKVTDCRYGLDLCARTLAAVLKYDTVIPVTRGQTYTRPTKGYYKSEASLVTKIKQSVLGSRHAPSTTPFKTLECQIMDIADDIAYSTYDLEDAFKAEFLSPMVLIAAENSLLDKVSDEINRSSKGEINPAVNRDQVRAVLLRIFDVYLKDDQMKVNDSRSRVKYLVRRYRALTRVAKVGYVRTAFTANLVGELISGIRFEPNKKEPALSRVFLNPSIRLKVAVLKQITYVSLIMSPRLKFAEYRGQEIVKTLFERLSENNGHVLLPDDYRQWYDRFVNDDAKRKRVICDFVAGMTDRYAVEFYARLRSESPETIFKPV
jgi:dGTPase